MFSSDGPRHDSLETPFSRLPPAAPRSSKNASRSTQARTAVATTTATTTATATTSFKGDEGDDEYESADEDGAGGADARKAAAGYAQSAFSMGAAETGASGHAATKIADPEVVGSVISLAQLAPTCARCTIGDAACFQRHRVFERGVGPISSIQSAIGIPTFGHADSVSAYNASVSVGNTVVIGTRPPQRHAVRVTHTIAALLSRSGLLLTETLEQEHQSRQQDAAVRLEAMNNMGGLTTPLFKATQAAYEEVKARLGSSVLNGLLPEVHTNRGTPPHIYNNSLLWPLPRLHPDASDVATVHIRPTIIGTMDMLAWLAWTRALEIIRGCSGSAGWRAAAITNQLEITYVDGEQQRDMGILLDVASDVVALHHILQSPAAGLSVERVCTQLTTTLFSLLRRVTTGASVYGWKILSKMVLDDVASSCNHRGAGLMAGSMAGSGNTTTTTSTSTSTSPTSTTLNASSPIPKAQATGRDFLVAVNESRTPVLYAAALYVHGIRSDSSIDPRDIIRSVVWCHAAFATMHAAMPAGHITRPSAKETSISDFLACIQGIARGLPLERLAFAGAVGLSLTRMCKAFGIVHDTCWQLADRISGGNRFIRQQDSVMMQRFGDIITDPSIDLDNLLLATHLSMKVAR